MFMWGYTRIKKYEDGTYALLCFNCNTTSVESMNVEICIEAWDNYIQCVNKYETIN